MYCQTGTHCEVNAGFETLIVNFCRPNLPGKRCDADVLSAAGLNFLGGDPSGVWTSMEKKLKGMHQRALLALKSAQALLLIPRWSLAK